MSLILSAQGRVATVAVLTGIFFLMATTACTRLRKESSSTSIPISASQWRALAERPIYFGHQSVGRDILSGIREITSGDATRQLRIVSGIDGERQDGIHEFAIGENGNPLSKIREFVDKVTAAKPPANSILMMKLCYADIKSDTDPNVVFEQYVRGIEQLRLAFPGRTIVHITAPLTTSENNAEYLVRKLLGRKTRREANMKRALFNAMLRHRYDAKDPIFDVAKIESTSANGNRISFVAHGQTGYAMAPEWTSDGGHLNEKGRVAVAESLLVQLAKLSG